MGRAFSFSLAAHAAFLLSFLLLSATRQPLPIVTAARPVRLVTYLEPSPAPRPRAAAIDAPAGRTLPAPVSRVPETSAPATPAPVAAPPVPVAVPKVLIPVPAARTVVPPPPAAEQRPALAERLAQRLASSAPSETRPAEVSPPRIASLPRPDPAAVPAVRSPSDAPAAPPGAVESVGHFPHAWYLALLKEQVYARWSPPSEFFQSRSTPVALVSFRITRAGKLEAVALKAGSGSARFDQSALAAVQGLGRVSALPELYREESLDVVIRFQNER